MPHFIKNCPICFEQFYTERIGKVYCGKKCSNKARSIPTKLLQALLDKVSRTTQVVETVPQVIKDFFAKHGSEVVVTSVRNGVDPVTEKSVLNGLELLGLSKAEQQDILETALKLKQDKRKKQLEKEFSEDIENPNNDQFVNKTDPAGGNSDGFK